MSEARTVFLKTTVDSGNPGPEHFDIKVSQVNAAELKDGEIIVKAIVFSADPYLRGRIKSNGSIKAGSPMSGFIAGKVVASKSSDWKENDLIGTMSPFSTVQIIDPKKTVAWKLTNVLEEKNISWGIGVLGMPGSTAYGGLLDVLRPEEKQTIFISGAGGAVGSIVGMISKNVKNCIVIGSAGGPDKCKMVKEKFGFDHCIDYKKCANTEELKAALKDVAPDGIDMYFENVGGMHFEAAFESLRPHGRIAVCGGISEYNNFTTNKISINPMQMIYTFQRIEGFISMPWLSGQKGNFLQDMAKWLQEGKVTPEETFFDGIENWPAAFQALFTGGNNGKVVVRV